MATPNDEEVRGEARSRGGGRVTIDRPTYDELQFEANFQPLGYKRLKINIPEPIRSHLTPPKNLKEWKNLLLGRIPILTWLYQYLPSLLFGDVISGITVGIMHIPQGMAYAVLADVPPVYGLYVSFLSPLIYSLFGTSRHISMGTFAVICLMVGDATSRYVDANPSLCETGNGTEETLDISKCPGALEVVFTITFATGLIMTILGVMQLGFITIFLSDALVSGYTTGAAVHVFSSQLRHIVGLDSSEVQVDPGAFSLPQKWYKVAREVFSGNIVWAAVIISVISILFLITVKIINKQLPRIKLYKKLPIPIPSQLILVILGTSATAVFKLDHRYDVPVVGDIPKGLPRLSTPKPTHFLSILPDAFTIAIVSYSVSISLSKVFATKHGYIIQSNQEFLAHGFTNIVCSFFSCFVSSGSLSRSVIQEVTGGNTQLVSFISSSILLIVLLWVAPLFQRLPNCTQSAWQLLSELVTNEDPVSYKAVLASTIIVALYGMFKQCKDLHKYYKLCIPDMLVWIVVFLATVFLGADIGLGVGIGFSLFLIIIRIILPTSAVLGKAENTEIYRNQLYFSNVRKIPGIVIFRFIAPLCFTNVSVFKSRLAKASGVNPAHFDHTIRPKGCLEQGVNVITEQIFERRDYSHERLTEDEEHDNIDTEVEINGGNIQENVERNILQSTEELIHTIVLDMAPVSFIDSAGAKTILLVIARYADCNIQVLLAATNKINREMLLRSGFMNQYGKEWLFPSIEDAVRFASEGNKVVRNCGDDLETNSPTEAFTLQVTNDPLQDNETGDIINETSL